MTIGRLIGLALAASLLPAVAYADDPTDASMRNPVARARDSAATRQLNLSELSRVHALEARGELGWHYANGTGNLARVNETGIDQRYQRARADYARDRAQYERDMAAWRRSVAACRNGDYSTCNN
jgi:hypothetical protein